MKPCVGEAGVAWRGVAPGHDRAASLLACAGLAIALGLLGCGAPESMVPQGAGFGREGSGSAGSGREAPAAALAEGIGSDVPGGGDAEAQSASMGQTQKIDAGSIAERMAREGAKAAAASSTRLLRTSQEATTDFVAKSMAPTRERVEAAGRDAFAWLNAATASRRDAVVAWLADAPPEATVSLEVATVLLGALESDVEITPIIRKVKGPEDEAAIDLAIDGLPSIEVMDGLEIGFQRMTRTDADVDEAKEAYLVTWRDGDQVIGLVVKTRRAIDIEELRAELPRLVRLVRGVL